MKPPNTASAFHVASQYVSMTPAEVDAANKAIAYETPATEVLSTGGMAGGGNKAFTANPSYRQHSPSGRPLLSREGGQTDLIASHMIALGHICLEKEVPSELIGHNYKDSEQQNFFTMQMGSLAGGNEIESFYSDKKRVSKFQNSCVANPPFKGLNQMMPLKEGIQDWAAETLRQQSEKLCKMPISTKGLKVHSRSFKTSDRNPESLSYMMSVLNNDRPFALHYDVSLMAKFPSDVSGWHASVVTGRRWNKEKNSCEIAIKNSWGEDCETAKEKWSCVKGNWWIDSELLANSKTEVIWIEKNQKNRN
ncbi:MAG: hypothetical protein EOP04_13955 [Proteobacteria bacterium]|nr:MAG: hypothetical protein EOP04_13955 [Pseudomonadota bacterium]